MEQAPYPYTIAERPNLRGHRVLIVESLAIAQKLAILLTKDQHMATEVIGEADFPNNLAATLLKLNSEALIVHAYGVDGAGHAQRLVHNICTAHFICPRVIVLEGLGVNTITERMYYVLAQYGIACVPKINVPAIVDTLARLFTEHPVKP